MSQLLDLRHNFKIKRQPSNFLFQQGGQLRNFSFQESGQKLVFFTTSSNFFSHFTARKIVIPQNNKVGNCPL